MADDSAYLGQLKGSLPRLLALYDRDESSVSTGVGDRYFWAWGLIDFANGTFQGAAHGLVRLWTSRQWPYATHDRDFLQLIDRLFKGARFCTRGDGSLEEAFPHEGSYCVTALVAFDLLVAAERLERDGRVEIPSGDWLATVEPMIRYLIRADESHAIISNHLATAVAALVRWHALTDDAAALARARLLMDRILAHQSEEGWFEEYGGADPGYQSLCLHYLADVHEQRPDWKLLPALARSVRFLWHFAHPDGSFGGVYGSRATRFYYPSGLLALARDVPEARALSDFMARSIADHRVVSLASMDEPNLVPMFNAYCWAAELSANEPENATVPVLPALDPEPARLRFDDAGLVIDRGPGHYTVISLNKGGALCHFAPGEPAIVDAGVVVRDRRGRLGSSQAFVNDNAVEIDDDSVRIEAPISRMPKRLPGPIGFLVLRLASVTLFRVSAVREWAKRRLVNLLITRRESWPAHNRRTIRFGAKLEVDDETVLPAGYERVEGLRDFVAIHMASQGYWQIQDEDPRP